MRKTSKSTPVYVNFSVDDVSSVVMATSGAVKDKKVDPRKLIGTIHVKKYLADTKINGKVETWISIVKKLTTPVEEGQSSPQLTSEEVAAFEECKAQTKLYLEEDASESLKTKVADSNDEMKNLKDVSSSMKFKFSKFAYEVVTHVINLMVRELLVFTCDNCASRDAKLTKVHHIPWTTLQTKLMAGLYMNTLAVFESVHPTDDDEDVSVSTDTEVDETGDEDEAAPEEVKVSKPRLSQYISNTFKEIISRDERFKGLLLGKEVTALINKIIYQTLDRFANVIKSLLDTACSKTVNERLALIATKILLQDHIHSTDADIAVVLDVVQARLEDLKTQAESDESSDETPETVKVPKTAQKEKKTKKTAKSP